MALKRRAKAPRFIGTALPGFTGVLPTWGRQRQSHSHFHSRVPGGGLSTDRTTWRPSSANVCVPVTALSPIARALCKEAMRHAGLREQIEPQAWTIPWTVHAQAQPHGHSAVTSLAPSVFRVAIATQRLVSLTDRPVTFTSRNVGRARPRTTPLEALELLRRFLQHVLPDGFVNVRPCGVLHARCALPPDTLRLLIGQARPSDGTPTRIVPPQPRVALCPTGGAPMRAVMRLGTSNRACVGGYQATAPVRPPHAIRQPRTTNDGRSIDPRGAQTSPLSPDDAHMATPHQGVRCATHTLP